MRQLVVDYLRSPGGLTKVGDHLYWSATEEGQGYCIFTVPLEGGAPRRIAGGFEKPLLLAGTGRRLYWVAQDDASLIYCEDPSGKPIVVGKSPMWFFTFSPPLTASVLLATESSCASRQIENWK